jgi:hypothetical protein
LSDGLLASAATSTAPAATAASAAG